jgi:hypothetical protein
VLYAPLSTTSSPKIAIFSKGHKVGI